MLLVLEESGGVRKWLCGKGHFRYIYRINVRHFFNIFIILLLFNNLYTKYPFNIFIPFISCLNLMIKYYFVDNQNLLFLNNNQNCNMSFQNYLKNFMRIKSEKESFKLGFCWLYTYYCTNDQKIFEFPSNNSCGNNELYPNQKIMSTRRHS